MGLADDLVAKFAKAVSAKNDTKNTSGTKLQGTIHFKDDKPYVKLDGSDILTPVQLTANVIENERVTVTIKDHMAIVDGNLSSPAARTADVDEVRSQIQTIKDRRRSVYYQDEVPTEGTYEEGDIWFETDAGNKMHYYEDGEWVEAQFDSEAIAPKAITTEKIDAKAVRAAQIDVQDLFAQDIEASGKIIGGRFISKPIKCWGGFASEDRSLINEIYLGYATPTPEQLLYLDVNMDGKVAPDDGGIVADWLNGDTSNIPGAYYNQEGLNECLAQVIIDTNDPDAAISIIVDRSYYGLSTILHTQIGKTSIRSNIVEANRFLSDGIEIGGAYVNAINANLSHIFSNGYERLNIVGDVRFHSNVEVNGPFNANGSVNVPLLPFGGPPLAPVPTAGVIEPSVASLVEALPDYKSYLGSIKLTGTWYSVISVRHRNGLEDGVNYGMYIRSLLTRAGDLVWNKQYGSSTWQGERTILDSGNYSNYTVPKTGGTFTGAVNANAGINASSPDFPTLNLTRSGVPYYAGLQFNNSLGVLGALGMSKVNGSLTRFRSDLATGYDLLDTGNYSSKIPAATQSAVGLMSAADKKKLDGIATGANKITVDGAMSSSSTNPVQNKVVKGQLPTSNQNATNGYIRFPSAKIQVAWIKKSVSTTITTPWGGLYENASPISIGNWAAAFSSVPAISYNVYISSGDAADTGVNSFSPPTTTSAGSVYLNRGTALSISRTYTVTAIGIGTYA